mmetsp:Transcript_15909/g.65074  ORF Transcript_15909/g.65074 Transcript_15909/m.65074 type:complete len:140 (+) Transcript_15909:1816-2235(+)
MSRMRHALRRCADHNDAFFVGFENLYAMEIEPQTAAESVLPREMLKDIAKFIPGVDELVSFSQIAKLVKSMEFSAVVFDTAPTGHTLKLLNFPKLFEKVLEQLGALKDRIDPLLQSLGPGLADSTGNPVMIQHSGTTGT